MTGCINLFHPADTSFVMNCERKKMVIFSQNQKIYLPLKGERERESPLKCTIYCVIIQSTNHVTAVECIRRYRHALSFD